MEYTIVIVVALETPPCKDKVGGSLTRDDLKVEERSRVVTPRFSLAGLRARFEMPALFKGHGGVVCIFLHSRSYVSLLSMSHDFLQTQSCQSLLLLVSVQSQWKRNIRKLTWC